MKEANSLQHEEDSAIFTGMKQKHDHEVEAKSSFPVLRQTSPVQHKCKVISEKALWQSCTHYLDSVICHFETHSSWSAIILHIKTFTSGYCF